MRIIWTDATPEQAKIDYKKVVAAHKRAMKQNGTWSVFGGVLTVNGNNYQVVNK